MNVAESERPTGAQVSCRVDGTTMTLGDPIEIATDLEPLPSAVVVGQTAGYEALRATELADLEGTLEGLADEAAPVLGAADLLALRSWSDDLSSLSTTARAVADQVLGLVQDAADVEAYLAEHVGEGTADNLPELAEFLTDRGYVDDQGNVLPAGAPVTVDGGHCLYLSENVTRVDGDSEGCAATRGDTWFVDVSDRIHPASAPELCVVPAIPAAAVALLGVGASLVLVRRANMR